MKKFRELEEKARDSLCHEITSEGKRLYDNDEYEKKATHDSKWLKNKIGLCSDCSSLNYCRSEFGNIVASCARFKIRITGRNRIMECTDYYQRGQMSLYDMYQIAWIINTNKNSVGFIQKEKKTKKTLAI